MPISCHLLNFSEKIKNINILGHKFGYLVSVNQSHNSYSSRDPYRGPKILCILYIYIYLKTQFSHQDLNTQPIKYVIIACFNENSKLNNIYYKQLPVFRVRCS